MNTSRQLAENAYACLQAAQKATDNETRIALLKQAQQWLELAAKAEKPKRDDPKPRSFS